MHSHSDPMLLANQNHEAKVIQGVTTNVLGLDGLSYIPLSPANLRMIRFYLSALNGIQIFREIGVQCVNTLPGLIMG